MIRRRKEAKSDIIVAERTIYQLELIGRITLIRNYRMVENESTEKVLFEDAWKRCIAR